MTQPVVPFWFAALIVVLGAMVGFALAFDSAQVAFITPTIKFVLGIVNAGLITLAAFLNIKRSE